MSESTLKKVNAHIELLEKECKNHESSLKMSEACNSIVEFVNASEDPFSKSYTGTNPYTTDQGGGCACAIM